jgi:hypothetical protein
LITKVLLSGAIALTAVVGTAAPAGADPTLFGVLSCGCQEASPGDNAIFSDHVMQGIQQGLTDPRVPH